MDDGKLELSDFDLGLNSFGDAGNPPKGNNLDIGNTLETSEALKVKDAAVGVSIPRAKGAESAAGAAQIDVDMATVDKAENFRNC